MAAIALGPQTPLKDQTRSVFIGFPLQSVIGRSNWSWISETLADHSAGNYRVLMNMGGELLAYGMAHEVTQLDEKCYLEMYERKSLRPATKRKVKA
jgi:hypothetical protein